MKPLFEFELDYTGPVPEEVSPEGRIGEAIGAGKGEVKGESVEGTVVWSLFEERYPEGVCAANHDGVIETSDGARIAFSTLGYFRQSKGNPNRWVLVAGLKFRTNDDRYQGLASKPALIEGVFDMESYRTTARAYEV